MILKLLILYVKVNLKKRKLLIGINFRTSCIQFTPAVLVQPFLDIINYGSGKGA